MAMSQDEARQILGIILVTLREFVPKRDQLAAFARRLEKQMLPAFRVTLPPSVAESDIDPLHK